MCHTILEMGSHDHSPHTFGSGLRFWKGFQKGFNKICLDLFSAKVRGSNWICYNYILKSLNLAWLSIGPNNIFVHIKI